MSLGMQVTPRSIPCLAHSFGHENISNLAVSFPYQHGNPHSQVVITKYPMKFSCSSSSNSSIPISSTVINFNKVIKINSWAFFSKFLHCISYFISFSKPKKNLTICIKKMFHKVCENISRRNGRRRIGSRRNGN